MMSGAMANSNHRDILKAGVEAWNRWRTQNPGVRPDLNRVDLARACLAGANLRVAQMNHSNLSRAALGESDFSGTALRRTNLSEADLSKTKLVKADLQQANLIGVRLRRADLRRADLRRADLFGADLTAADLRGANLTGANLGSATITGALLYGSIREDWCIEGIMCDHIFWDSAGCRRSPLQGKFRDHQFESIYGTLPSVALHFAACLDGHAQPDTLELERNTAGAPGRLTPRTMMETIGPYLQAVADLQELVNEYSGSPPTPVAIVSIKQKPYTRVALSGATPLLALIRETIVPWRRQYRDQLEQLRRAMTKASIIKQEAEILEIRSDTEKNPLEAKMFRAEAAKKRTEAQLMSQRTGTTQRYIYQLIETALIALVPAETLSAEALAHFRQRAAASIRKLAESDLAD
jgi:Pentapeptide repeats (8 copies)